ncbi:MAG: UPF0104 family protein, partial [Bdellovibrio sp.]
MKDRFFTLLKVIIAVGLIVWLVAKGNLSLKDMSHLFSPLAFLFFMGLAVINLLITAWRWHVLLKAKGFSLSFKDVFPLQLIGVFFSFALPAGSVGGDLVKGYYVIKGEDQRKLDAGMTVLMDRIVGLYAMVFLGLFFMTLKVSVFWNSPALFSLYMMTAAAFGGLTLVLLLAFSHKAFSLFNKILVHMPLGDKVLKVYEGMKSYRNHKLALIKAFSLSLLAQAVGVLFFMVAGSFLKVSGVPWTTYFFVVPIGMLITAIPLSQGGVGVGQVAMMYLFGVFTGIKDLVVGQVGITMFQLTLFLW